MEFPQLQGPKKRTVPDLFSSEIQQMVMTIIASVNKNFPANQNLSIWNQACQTMYYELLHASDQFQEKYKKAYDLQSQQYPENQKEARKHLNAAKTRLRKKVQAGMRQFEFFSEIIRILTLNFFAWERSYIEHSKLKSQKRSNQLIYKNYVTVHEYMLAVYKTMRYNQEKKFSTPLFDQEKQQYFEKFKETINEICKCQILQFSVNYLGVPQDQIHNYMAKWAKRKLQKEIQLKNSRNISIIHLKERKPRKQKPQTIYRQRQEKQQIIQLRKAIQVVTKIQEGYERRFERSNDKQTFEKEKQISNKFQAKTRVPIEYLNPQLNYEILQIKRKQLIKQEQRYRSAKQFDQDIFCCLALENNQGTQKMQYQKAKANKKCQPNSLNKISIQNKDASQATIEKFLKQTAMSLNQSKIKQQVQHFQNIFEQTQDEQSKFSFQKQFLSPKNSPVYFKEGQTEQKKFARFCEQFLNISKSYEVQLNQLKKEFEVKPKDKEMHKK